MPDIVKAFALERLLGTNSLLESCTEDQFSVLNLLRKNPQLFGEINWGSILNKDRLELMACLVS